MHVPYQILTDLSGSPYGQSTGQDLCVTILGDVNLTDGGNHRLNAQD
jgi:hypothetical protein